MARSNRNPSFFACASMVVLRLYLVGITEHLTPTPGAPGSGPNFAEFTF
jgi:hypothetical protein